MIAENPRKLEQNVTVQHVDAETLVYDERRHQAFCLNATSAAVWNLSDGTRSVEFLARDASAQLGAPVTMELVRFALAGLERDGLLADTVRIPAATYATTRRQMLGSLGAASLVAVPAVAMLMTPKAAQAYGGCFNCTPTAFSAAAQRRADAEGAQLNDSSSSEVTDSDPMFR